MSLDRLDWALCRSFLAILRQGSLSGAARVLNVAHPTMRRHLDELEAMIGAALFVRSPSGLMPTALAIELREPAESMEAAAEALIRSASAEAGEVAGTVRLTASEIMGVEVLPAFLAAIRTSHPRLDFEVVLTNTVQDLRRRDADIAIRMTRPIQSDLVARKVGETRLGIYAHRDWVAAHEAPTSLEALVRSGQLVGYDRGDTSILRGLAARGVHATAADFCFRSDSDLAQLAAIRAAVGVGFCQIRIADRDPNLQRLLADLEFGLEIWLVAHASNLSTSRVRLVFDTLARDLQKYGSASKSRPL
jgi:DNA-binding transcriptional LysR family regulator